jgi:predicted nucleotidyltransferase
MEAYNQAIHESQLISTREEIVGKIEDEFKDIAVEAHLFGSLARGDADAYSDIDMWLVVRDEKYAQVFENRFAYYSRLGEIVSVSEPPQNAPAGGVHSALLIKIDGIITIVDLYLCPLSKAFITDQSKKLYGIDLPKGVAGFNTEKVLVDDEYRINFFTGFIFNTIKKIARKEEKPLDAVFREYENLYQKYNFDLPPLENSEHTFQNLELIIKNIESIATQKQKQALTTIHEFAKKVLV